MKKSEDPYTPENIPLYEKIFGENLISLGGTAAIENMFSDVNLIGLKLLDIGFGLGGVAYYLAQTRHVQVSGVEVPAWMAEHAENHAPKDIANLLNFCSYDPSGSLPFESEFFDLAYSKGVFNHIKDKSHLVSEVNRVLKNDGQLVIADWLHTTYEASDASPLVKETKETYEKVLQECGFSDINFRDDSNSFISYVNSLLDSLSENKSSIEEEYGKEMCDTISTDYQQLIEDINLKNKFAVRITARKNG